MITFQMHERSREGINLSTYYETSGRKALNGEIHIPSMTYHNKIPRETVKEIYKFVINLRSRKGFGQRRLAAKVADKFSIIISESTISGWIHKNLVPYANENTQFKPKPIPTQRELTRYYFEESLSASAIGRKYNVATITVINWLKSHNIPIRTHKESMNTRETKELLRQKKLARPINTCTNLTLEKAYILGVLCSDGYLSEKIAKLEIRNDVEFIEEFSRCISKVYGINYNHYYYEPRDSFILYVSSQLIAQDMLKYGTFRTYTWQVPKEIEISNNKEIIGFFLRGVYDGDGHVSKYAITLHSSSLKGIHGLSKLLKELGITSYVKSYGKRNLIYITKKENLRLFKDLVGFTIKRKKERLEDNVK